MEDYIRIIISVLEWSVLASIIATNVVNGLKNAIGYNNSIFIRVLTFVVDILMSYWVYFGVAKQTDLLTFAVVSICCYAGAEAIYEMMGSLTESKKKTQKIEETLIVEDLDEEKVG